MTIPDQIEQFGQDMSLVYEWCVNRVLTNIARRFPYVENEDAKGSFEWQSAKMAAFGQCNKENAQIIRDSLKGVPNALKRTLESEIIKAVGKVEPDLQEAAKSGFLMDSAIVPKMDKSIENAFRVFYEQAADKLNLVNTVMLDSTEQAYKGIVSDVVAKMERSQQIIDNATGSVVTGVESLNSAMRQAVNQMIENGLTGFIDHAGKKWRPEAYVMMDMRTTAANAARQAAFDRCDDFGSDIIQIDSHAGARPLCYPWQGKLISRADNSRDVEDLYGTTVHVYALNETSYGQPAGLFGINCRHFGTPFIPGFSGLGNPDLIQTEEENQKTYELTQEQRAYERAIRQARLNRSIAKARGDQEAFDKADAKVNELTDRLQQFCEDNGLPRRKNREYTPTNATWPDDTDTSYPYGVTPAKGNAGRGKAKASKDYFTKPEEQNKEQKAETKPETKKAKEPTKPQVQEKASAFVPAKSLAEAEAFTKSFCDENTFGNYGISFNGVSLETANTVNQRLYEFYQTYKVDKKFGGVIAPAGNTKLGKTMSGATAAYNSFNRCFILSRKTCKTPDIAIKALAREKQLVKDYLANPNGYTFLTGATRKVLENSAQSGRGTVPDTLVDVLNHELGHSLEKQIKKLDSFAAIEKNWQTYAPQISGYATTEIGEYIAESFASYCKGESITDPELVAAFESLRR